MPNRALAIVCDCGCVVAAYDPHRSSPLELAQAIRAADRRGRQVELRESPVRIHCCACPSPPRLATVWPPRPAPG